MSAHSKRKLLAKISNFTRTISLVCDEFKQKYTFKLTLVKDEFNHPNKITDFIEQLWEEE